TIIYKPLCPSALLHCCGEGSENPPESPAHLSPLPCITRRAASVTLRAPMTRTSSSLLITHVCTLCMQDPRQTTPQNVGPGRVYRRFFWWPFL
ncbi:hypothetical protein KUCAC02_001400, partial [Chaenocephalus aceratus]